VLQLGPGGGIDGLEFPTDVLSPGLWFWVFQGRQSGHRSIVYFYIYQ
jgi:hypothetical protein